MSIFQGDAQQRARVVSTVTSDLIIFFHPLSSTDSREAIDCCRFSDHNRIDLSKSDLNRVIRWMSFNGDSVSKFASSFAGLSFRLKFARHLLCEDHALAYHQSRQEHQKGKPIPTKGWSQKHC